MAREIEIELENTKFIAILLESKAPRTCDVFWDLLPFQGEALHCTWSGQCIYSHGGFPKLDQENASPFTSQGDILLCDSGEIILVYGKKCYIRDARSDDCKSNDYACNHFAKIQDVEQFEGIGECLKKEGVKRIDIRKS